MAVRGAEGVLILSSGCALACPLLDFRLPTGVRRGCQRRQRQSVRRRTLADAADYQTLPVWAVLPGCGIPWRRAATRPASMAALGHAQPVAGRGTRRGLDGAVLHVRQSLQRVDGSLTFVPAKTVRSHRKLPIPTRLAELLRQHRVAQAGERFERGDSWTETGLVFTTTIGTPLEPRNVNRRFDQLRATAGLPWLRLHDLRHAFASMLFSEGVPARTVMELLGHSTIQLTMNTYTHVMPETQREAVGRLEHLFTDDRPEDDEDDSTEQAGDADPTDTDEQ
ncbi:site-specific integrase [Frankia sp. Cppng1_Ct_nod]|uniref:tyrosine-type recombinase/integrase n=1 Tax=Frankia sp. Cppng1_Ct_nod TaxID=2897162 RepID=UPI001F5E6BB3|nr:site-specific integrase [Frankia sp. Cppng1_Ct_nod]